MAGELYWNGLGNELGNGMGLFVQQFVGTQNTLKQQDEQRRQQEAQLALQRQQVEAQATRDAEARRQFDEQQARLARLDAVTQSKDDASNREGTYRNVLAPQMNEYMKAVDTDLARYAPTLPSGAPNPQYNPAMFEATKARKQTALKQWSNLGLSVGTGEGWHDAVTRFTSFVGGENPLAGQAAPMQTPGAAPTGMALPGSAGTPQAAPPAPVTLPSAGESGATFDYTPAPQAAPAPEVRSDPAQPAPAALPAGLPERITDVPPSQLATLSDEQLAQKYTNPTDLEYARAARAEYIRQVQAQQAAAAKSRADAWDIQLKELSKDPTLTGDQRYAMQVISSLMAKPTMTEDDAALLQQAFATISPRVYTAANWQKMLETKDPTVIYAQYGVYKKYAPEVVEGFNIDLIGNVIQGKMDGDAADAALKYAQGGKALADTERVKTLLPGEVREQDDKHAESVVDVANTAADTGLKTAQTAGAQATTRRTVQDMAGTKTDQAVKLLGQLAALPPGMSYDQVGKQMPGLVAQIKGALGLNDAGLNNLMRQAQYSYGLGLRGKELENELKGSEILSENANRGATLARTTLTLEQARTEVALRDPKVRELDARIELAKAQGRNYDSLAAERNALVDERAALMVAQASSATSSANLNTARAVVLPQQVAIQQQDANTRAEAVRVQRGRLDLAVNEAKGQAQVDTARIGLITAQTLLTRAKNPNDELYNPALANATKPGDPLTEAKKKADIFYGQAGRAQAQANTIQGQINTLLKSYTNFSGNPDMKKLQASPDWGRFQELTKQRDQQLQVVANRTRAGDNVLAPILSGETPGGGQAGQGSADPYSTTQYGGIQMVTKFTGTTPVPKSFTTDARYHISRVAGRLGVDANALAAVISFESAGSFNPAKKNPGYTDNNGVFHPSSASGLIQFIEPTAKTLGTTTAALRAMSFGKQMEYVERYLKQRGIGPGSSMADIYQAVAGSGYKKGTKEYNANVVWDSDKNGVIDAREQTLNPAFAQHVRDYFGTAGKAGPAAPGTPAPARPATPAAQAPARPVAAAPAAALPPLAGKAPTPAQTAQLRAGFRAITSVTDPAKQQAKGAEVVATLAAQFKVTPAQMFEYLKNNGGRL